MRAATLFLLLLVTASMNAQRAYVPYLQKKVLRQIAACATETCIDAAVARAPYIDPPIRLIAASKVSELNEHGANARLLAAIPQDPVAFWFCYSVTAVGKDFEKISRLFDTFFPAAGAAAAATGDVTSFMRLAAFADGEIAAAIAEDLETLRKRNAPAYCRAWNAFHPDVKRHLPPCAATPS